MVSCEKCLEDFILFDINMCSKLMEQILSTTYKIRNELHRLKVSLLIQKIGPKKSGPQIGPSKNSDQKCETQTGPSKNAD